MNVALALASGSMPGVTLPGTADAPTRVVGGVAVGRDAHHDRQGDRRHAQALALALGSPEFQTAVETRPNAGPERGCMVRFRRVFLKNGAFALVSLGFAPSFLARTVCGSRAVGAASTSS